VQTGSSYARTQRDGKPKNGISFFVKGNNTVEPGYNNAGLYDASSIASDILW
jgi:hypothetical protein